MTTSINILPSGDYEVSVYLRDSTGYGRWHSLRCFTSQGEAREFCHHDVPRFSDRELLQFSRTYDRDKPYRRLGFRKYRPASDTFS